MSKIWRHILFTFLCNLGPFAFGVNLGWLTPFVEQLKDQETSPYKPALATDEISLLAGILPISMVIAAPFYGIFLKYFSCKTLSLYINITHCFSFALFLVPNIIVAYIARFTGGVASVGSIVITPLYINECVNLKYRGLLGAMCSLSVTLGVFGAFTIGSLSGFLAMNIFGSSSVAIFFLFYFWLPDSPIWLIMHYRMADVEASLRKIGCEDNEQVQQQILTIQEDLKVSSSEKSVGFGTVLKDRALRKALFLSTGLMAAQQCTGITAIQIFFLEFLTSWKLEYQQNVPMIFSGVTQLFGAVVGAVLLRYMGRKIILLVTTMLICLCHAFLCSGIHFDAFPSAPFASLLIFIGSYSIGLGTVPFAMLPELLPQAARGICVAVAGLLTGTLSFAYAYAFFPILSMYGFQTIFIIFTLGSVLALLFIALCLFETKDKSPSQIYTKLLGAPNC